MVKVGDTLNGFSIVAVARVSDYVVILGAREWVHNGEIRTEHVTAAVDGDTSYWGGGRYFVDGPPSAQRARARADFVNRAGWGTNGSATVDGRHAQVVVVFHGV